MITIKSLNISEKKGTIKTPVSSAFIGYEGMEDDAHAGPWHRQISLLAYEATERFNKESDLNALPGEFGENITTQGYDLTKLNLLDMLIHKQVSLEVTQLGKSCHGKGCSIYTQVGKCVMPAEGIFTRVVLQGELKTGDTFIHKPYIFSVLVITLSDRASNGIYDDLSGTLIEEKMIEFFTSKNREYKIERQLIPDDAKQLEQLVKQGIKDNIDIIITTGGTGVSARDITPDVIKPMITKELPGIMEHIRTKYGAEKAGALLSRGVAGVTDKSFIITLPGSKRAVNEYITELNPLFLHIIYMMHGLDQH